jgi:hypothetical protein
VPSPVRRTEGGRRATVLWSLAVSLQSPCAVLSWSSIETPSARGSSDARTIRTLRIGRDGHTLTLTFSSLAELDDPTHQRLDVLFCAYDRRWSQKEEETYWSPPGVIAPFIAEATHSCMRAMRAHRMQLWLQAPSSGGAQHRMLQEPNNKVPPTFHQKFPSRCSTIGTTRVSTLSSACEI